MECVRDIHFRSQVRNPPIDAVDFVEDQFQEFYAQDDQVVSLVPANSIAFLMSEKTSSSHQRLARHLCSTFEAWKLSIPIDAATGKPLTKEKVNAVSSEVMSDLALRDREMDAIAMNLAGAGAKKAKLRGMHGFETPVFLLVREGAREIVEYSASSGRKMLSVSFDSIKKFHFFKYQGNKVQMVGVREQEKEG